MPTTITVTDVDTDPTFSSVTLTVTFDNDGHQWTQAFTINPSLTSYMTTAQEYVDYVKTVLTQHAIEVAANRDELDAKGEWRFTSDLKGLTFTTAK